MIRHILQLGNPVLREKSAPVGNFNSKELEKIARDLSDTLRSARSNFRYGRGIAAPQIGVLKRMVFVDTAEFKGPLINPRISWASDSTFEVWDSCFSFSLAFFVLVDRFDAVEVEYCDVNGKEQILRAERGLSELLQHEIDHLDGILAVDRMKDTTKIVMRSEHEKTFR